MAADSGIALHTLRVDGGMVAQQLPDAVPGRYSRRARAAAGRHETTALGAAYLAGLAAGVWSSTAELATQWRAERTYEPRMSADERDSLYTNWKHAVHTAQG